VPTVADLNNGEWVQLPFYALLAGETVTRAGALVLAPGKASMPRHLDGEALRAASGATAQRLELLAGRLAAGVALPAWGATPVCDRCEYSGLCRHDQWYALRPEQGVA
jgi:hypothetical protein